MCSFIVSKPTSYSVAIIFCVSHIFSILHFLKAVARFPDTRITHTKRVRFDNQPVKKRIDDAAHDAVSHIIAGCRKFPSRLNTCNRRFRKTPCNISAVAGSRKTKNHMQCNSISVHFQVPIGISYSLSAYAVNPAAS